MNGGERPVSGAGQRRPEVGVGARLGAFAVGAGIALRAYVPGPGTQPSWEPRCQVVFVAGCPRSGTTWVMSMLQQHPLVFGALESHAYRLTGALRRRGPRNPRGWAALFRDIEPVPGLGLLPYADQRTIRRLALAAARSSATGAEAADKLIGSVFDHYAASQGAGPGHVLVEKTPGHLLWAEEILGRFPTARMIEVVRDGRDVCVSMQFRSAHVAWAKAARSDQIRTWVSYVEAGNRLQARPAVADRVLRVRYEDLKGDPRSGLARMLDFAGVDAAEEEVDRIVASTDIGSYRGPTDGSAPKRKGMVGDWRNHFDESDLALFTRLAGDAARGAGYET